MDYLSNKAIVIGVTIIVTLTIASGIMFTISQIRGIYQGVYNKDVSIKQNFYEFDMYDNTVLTGLEVYNTAKKYLDSSRVTVIVINSYNIANQVNTASAVASIWNDLNTGVSEPYKFERKFNTTYVEDNIGRITITCRVMP